MLRFSRFRLEQLPHQVPARHPMEAGSRKVTSLVVDFLGDCTEYHGIKFHAPVLFGLRPQIGLRGLYLAEGFKVKRNTPIFTVPFSGILSTENVLQQPNAPAITLQDIEANMIDKELLPLATHILFGTHFAEQVAALPKHHSRELDPDNLTLDEYEAMLKFFTGGIMPWARMIDDENFTEDHVLGTYRSALDKWQLQDYNDLYNMFNRNMTELHHKLKLSCTNEDFRRITRVCIARVEQVPPATELYTSRFHRLATRAYRRLMKQPIKPKPDLRMIPLMDMINHSNRANTWMRVLPDGTDLGVKGPCVSLFALNDIEGGRELCRYYNFAMSRGNALFRYGFLPFEMMAMDNFDPWKEHYVKGVAPNLLPESEEEAKKRIEIEKEVARMQEIFRQTRYSGSSTGSVPKKNSAATTSTKSTSSTNSSDGAENNEGMQTGFGGYQPPKF
jgi:hypothetical protein